MIEIDRVSNRLLEQGYVCIVDDFEERAALVMYDGKDRKAFVKCKGGKEVQFPHYEDIVQDIINELHNREITKEEYDNY